MSTSVRVKRLRPGDDTETYCGRCKAERMHQIVALNADGRPATVICRTCGNQHRFHEKKTASASASRSTTRGARSTPVRDEPTALIRPYSPTNVYSAGDWVEHPKFGQGKVTQTRSGKIEVRFDSGNRLLVHAG